MVVRSGILIKSTSACLQACSKESSTGQKLSNHSTKDAPSPTLIALPSEATGMIVSIYTFLACQSDPDLHHLAPVISGQAMLLVLLPEMQNYSFEQ